MHLDIKVSNITGNLLDEFWEISTPDGWSATIVNVGKGNYPFEFSVCHPTKTPVPATGTESSFSNAIAVVSRHIWGRNNIAK